MLAQGGCASISHWLGSFCTLIGQFWNCRENFVIFSHWLGSFEILPNQCVMLAHNIILRRRTSNVWSYGGTSFTYLGICGRIQFHFHFFLIKWWKLWEIRADHRRFWWSQSYFRIYLVGRYNFCFLLWLNARWCAVMTYDT